MLPPLNEFTRFDVVDRLRQAIEPFPEDFVCVNALAAGGGLFVITLFLPSPLIERLASTGFASNGKRGQGCNWLVYFLREGV